MAAKTPRLLLLKKLSVLKPDYFKITGTLSFDNSKGFLKNRIFALNAAASVTGSIDNFHFRY
jgi:hypothetical protein